MSSDDDNDRPGFSADNWRSTTIVERALAPRGIPVSNSDELQRIINLPRRNYDQTNPQTREALVEMMQRRLSLNVPSGQCNCAKISKQIADGKRKCITRLKWEQAFALYEIDLVGGLIANISVGGGKTACDILAPLILSDHVRRVTGGAQNCNHTVLLVPPSLLGQIWTDYQLIAQHYRVPGVIVHIPGAKKPPQLPPRRAPDGTEEPWLRILSYNALSGMKNSNLLEELGPSAIIADEVDQLKDVTASRVLRLLRYFENHESTTRFCGWTGSLTSSSVREFAHLSCLALRLGSPLPVKKRVIEEWSACLDAVPNPTPPGALIRLLEPGEGTHELRKALKRRMSSTPGFIMIEGRQIITIESGEHKGERVEVEILERAAPPMTPRVLEALDKVRNWTRPDTMVGGEDDEIMEDQLARARTAREVASGMLYRWIFPRKEPQWLKQQWFAARKAWHHELRQKVLKNEPLLDSKKLCENAAMRAWGHASQAAGLPEWRAETFEDWFKVKDQVKHVAKAERLDGFLIEDAADWAVQNRGIIWYTMREFAQWLAQRVREKHGADLPIYGEGSGDKIIEDESGARSIIASLKSHGRGRNGLQFMYDHQLFAQFPSSSRMVQQCLDAETEILTNCGWLGIDSDWTNANAAAYDIKDGSVHWSRAERVERALGDEQMYGIRNPHLDIRVTAGHRMVCERKRRRGNGGCDGAYYAEATFVTADRMPTNARIPVAGIQETQGVALTDDEIMFLGLFLTDGNLSTKQGHKTNIRLFQSERYPEIIEIIEKAVAGCGFKASRTVYTKPSNFGARSPLHIWTISKGVPRRLVERATGLTGWARLEPYIEKNLNEAYEGLSARQLRVLLTGMWAGDGSKTCGTYAYNHYQAHTWNIATCRKPVADRLQSLCARRGFRCNVKQIREQFWMMHISDDLVWTTTTYSTDTRPTWGVLPSSPTERVWCVEVDTGAIITRRNGKVAVVGNCLARLHRPGQSSLKTRSEIYLHTEELQNGFNQAIRQSEYVEALTGEKQKLLDGWEDRDLDDD